MSWGQSEVLFWKPQGSDKVFKKCYVAKEELEAILVRNMIVGAEREIQIGSKQAKSEGTVYKIYKI